MTHDTDLVALIHELEERRYAAMIAGDIAALEALLSDRLAYTHSNAEIDTKQSYLEKVKSGHFDYKEITRPKEEIVVNGDTALVVGRMVARLILDHKTERHLDNLSLAVWSKESGGWKLMAYQPTVIPKA